MISLLAPVRCVACGAGGAQLCAGCVGGLCEPDPFDVPEGLDSCLALLSYEGVGRRVVGALKFRGERSLAGVLGAAMARLVVDGASAPSLDVVTWAPTTARHRRSRGFDQAAELARSVSTALGLPLCGLLAHAGGGGLTGRSRAERQGAVTFQPLAARGCRPELDRRWTGLAAHGPRRAVINAGGANVLLVDDVVTTGVTLAAAARALRAAGAHAVHGLVLAATPSPARC